jgi:hypothetical protein
MRRDLESAHLIGRTWLAEQSPSPGISELLSGICGDEHCADFGDDPEAAPRLIAARHRSDFERGNLVSVRGWQLTATEVHLYALVALEAASPSH